MYGTRVSFAGEGMAVQYTRPRSQAEWTVMRHRYMMQAARVRPEGVDQITAGSLGSLPLQPGALARSGVVRDVHVVSGTVYCFIVRGGAGGVF